MSEPIPESIPTSADPRSKRPTKKRLINAPATAKQASQIDALFSKPDLDIRISSNADAKKKAHVSAPPEIVQNVQGSSAGAGSGEFHVYKASRRREYERLKRMDEEVKEEEVKDEWEKEKREREERDREVTRRKREKREKKKGKHTGKDNEGSESCKKREPGLGSAEQKISMKAYASVSRGRVLGDEENENLESDKATRVEEPNGVIIHDDD